jgi:hypothetical protein
MALQGIDGSQITSGTINADRLSFKSFPRTEQLGLTKTSNSNNVASRVLFTNKALASTTIIDDVLVDVNGIVQHDYTLVTNNSNEVIGIDFGAGVDLGSLKVNVSWVTALEV